MNKSKKIVAVALSGVMILSSGLVAGASNGTTSTGTSAGHVDKDVITVTLPSDNTTIFNYTVDPEKLIKNAGTLQNGTTVQGNDDGVYFINAGTAAVAGSVSAYKVGTDTTGYTFTVSDLNTNAEYKYDGTNSKWQVKADDSSYTDTTVTITAVKDADSTNVTFSDGDTVTVSGAVAAGAATYSSTSDAATFAGQNSVDVDVTVTATVTAGSNNDITLVADETALAAATTPALLLKMTVGSDVKAITSSGATAKATVTGKPDNFEIKSNGTAFEYKVKSDATGWDSKTLTLSGKVNNVDVASNMTVPSVALVWTVAKHVAVAPTLDATASYEIGSDDDLVLTTSNVASITKVVLGETELTANTGYTVDTNKLTIKKAALAAVTEAGDVNLKVTATSTEVTTGTELTCKITFAAASVQTATLLYLTGNDEFWFGLTEDAGFETNVTPTKVELEGVDVTSVATVAEDGGTYWIVVSWDDAASLDVPNQSDYTMTVTIDGVVYEGTVEGI